MAGEISTWRGDIALPEEVSKEILQKTQEGSAVMKLARQIKLPGNGLTIPVILGDPEASWVGETQKKPVSNPNVTTKHMKGYTLAVIVPFSNQFRRDTRSLYDALVQRLPLALAQKFDKTVFGGVAVPGDKFDSFAGCTKQDIGTDAYGGLVAADTDIALHNGITNGFVISPQAKGVLLTAKDKNDRPIFINSVAEGAIPMILGSKTELSKGAYIAGTAADKPNIVGVAGDWTQAMYGVVEGVSISISEEASITVDGTAINLWERNMFAVRAEIEIGFIADTACFDLLTTPYESGDTGETEDTEETEETEETEQTE
ncbi:MAG: phage major capsid protein [Lachnospiraceae bacterium]|nr:phage major capsid protein [Lachnospiraceae bacterium]